MSDEERERPARGSGRRGTGTRPVDPARPCMNCGDPTPGEYCPTCGQRKVDAKVSVRTMVMDVLEDQFTLDQRLPRTLVALLFKPGFLTAEHLSGRIVRYIRPFRLYLASSIIFFLLLSFLSVQMVRRSEVGTRVERDREGAVSDSARVVRLDSTLMGIDSALVVLDSTLAESALPAAAVAAISSSRASLERDQARRRAERDSLLAVMSGSAAGDEPRAPPDEAAPPREVTGPSGPVSVEDTVGTPWLRGEDLEVSIGIPRVDQAIRQKLTSLSYLPPREALETVVADFMSYVPTMMFILLPVFAAVLKLLYIRRRRFYAEHFVFLLHVHSFVYLLAAAMLLLRTYVAAWLEVVLIGWLLIYILLAMKKVYGQGWLKTILKYWALGWTYFWILTFAFPVAFVVTILLL